MVDRASRENEVRAEAEAARIRRETRANKRWAFRRRRAVRFSLYGAWGGVERRREERGAERRACSVAVHAVGRCCRHNAKRLLFRSLAFFPERVG